MKIAANRAKRREERTGSSESTEGGVVCGGGSVTSLRVVSTNDTGFEGLCPGRGVAGGNDGACAGGPLGNRLSNGGGVTMAMRTVDPSEGIGVPARSGPSM